MGHQVLKGTGHLLLIIQTVLDDSFLKLKPGKLTFHLVTALGISQVKLIFICLASEICLM